ncbi:unnamed protein product [Cercopithifilaria johnstoni]|uniref:Uncharacterized protein n=1 Tax=Cercopithifilaria johnstoni TaxID=2874296 RepID=A0A8J2M7N1_9BILA|nr:unnamed protein product [Cercopithifilaria johnstoni]
MEWPKFDFAKRSHVRSRRLSSAGKSNSGLRKSYPNVCRSLTADFENIKFRKKESLTKGNTAQNESIVTLRQQALQNSSSPIRSQRNPFQMNGKMNKERIPPLSPILVNGFLKNPTTYLSTPLRRSSSNLEEMLTSLRYTSSINPVGTSISYCESPIARESPEPLLTPPYAKQLLLSDGNPTFSLQRSVVTQRSQTFDNQSQVSSFVTIAEKSNNLSSKCRKNGKKVNHSTKLRAFPSIAASISAHSLDSSLTSVETLPPSQTDCKNLNKDENFPKLDFISSQLSFESGESITTRHTGSDSDVFQTHTVCVDDSDSVTTTSEKSRDCFLDITIHEIEPSDPSFERELFVQNTSSATNQLKIYDLQEENDETPHQKQYHRLSKLAETLKKRLFISSSDLVMWKCEEPKQQPIRQVAVISNVEQWGFCWTLVKDVSDFETAHIVDSEPMKKITDVMSRNRSEKARNTNDDNEGQRCHDSPSQETFFLYQPLSKLSTSTGEFILSPRYYR